jgi:hypothetical protein
MLAFNMGDCECLIYVVVDVSRPSRNYDNSIKAIRRNGTNQRPVLVDLQIN